MISSKRLQQKFRRAAWVTGLFGFCAAVGVAEIKMARVFVDSAETVQIVDAAGRQLTPPKVSEQVSASEAKLADDSRTAGWLVNYANCCTSYPIPLTLVIYRDGNIARQIKPGLMIFDWDFRESGRQAALCDGTVHGNQVPHCLLYDARSGKKVAEWDGRQGQPPAWVGKLRYE